MSDELRGTGRTTQQLIAAPTGALFVVHTQYAIPYARSLANSLARGDIFIASIEGAFRNMGDRLLGRKPADVVIDHFALEYMQRNYVREFVFYEEWVARHG